MKIVCIADAHEKHESLNELEGDLLLHAGDLTWTGEIKATVKFLSWFAARPFTHKIFIAGNHDFLFEQNPALAKSLVPAGVIYLVFGHIHEAYGQTVKYGTRFVNASICNARYEAVHEPVVVHL